MKGKTGSIEINLPEWSGEFWCKAWLRSIWDYCNEDSARVKFPLKVGIAVLLVSLLILFQAPFHVFGTNIIWAILTAVLVFEYTVGSTFNRGFNRALGSLLAGILAIAVAQTALSCGRAAEPVIIGLSIFFVAAITSFMKMWPSLVQYEYGLRVILLTYCLIVVSGYRMGNPIRTSVDRLYSISIGGIISVLVNVLVFPIWAGEQLLKELVRNFDSVADSLEECVKKYLQDEGSEQYEIIATEMDEFPNEPAYKRCLSTLNSGPKLENLANCAKWEPPHGRFLHFFYPWSQYVKVGAVLRYCACEVMALHSILHSEIQAPYKLRFAFQSEIQEASRQAAELVRTLSKDISNMRWSLKTTQIQTLHRSTEQLQRSIDLHYYLLTFTFESPNSKPHRKLFPSLSSTADQMAELESKSPENDSPNHASRNIPTRQMECCHEMMKKQSRTRRLRSWPSGAFEEDSNGTSTVTDTLPRMKAFESTASLSLPNFTSSLIEFVARLDHLVEAVDKLSKMANFKPRELC